MLGRHEILKGVDMEAGDREFIGVIGPNGSGKSTLLRCIYRVLSPVQGAVYIASRPLSEYRPKDSARKIAVVAQHNYYNFDFTVQDVVLMGRAPHKRALDRDTAEDYALVREALETVGMSAFAERSFSSLSGGEQQRVILARALAQQTPCLILDEPTNHLDIKYQLQLMDIVKALDGLIVAAGTPDEVLTPERIRTLYEVDAEVMRDRTGLLHILYHPQHSGARQDEPDNPIET